MTPHLPGPTPELIPRRALLSGGAAVLVTLAATAAARLSGFDTTQPDAGVATQRRLHFLDLPDRGIAIVDADSGAQLEVLHGEQGFLRGTLRGLARERKRRGIGGSGSGSGEALHLIGRTDGRLTLLDPSTGQRIDLESFGPSNAAVFARWLERTRTSRSPT